MQIRRFQVVFALVRRPMRLSCCRQGHMGLIQMGAERRINRSTRPVRRYEDLANSTATQTRSKKGRSGSAWYMDTFDEAKNKPISERIEEREDATRDFLEYHANRHRSSFWVLFRSLARDASVIWTNTAKIGVCRPPDESKPINP